MPILLEIVTPERLAYSDSVDAVVLPGIEGELGVLPHHAPLVSMLGVGELRIRKGGTEESTVYQVVWHPDTSQLTDVNIRSFKIIPGDQGSLLVSHRNTSLRLDQSRPNISIGRGEECELVVNEKLASRKHVSIRLINTNFYLVDHSLNGTFVSLESGEEVHVLRKELLLDSAGTMTLGRGAHEDEDVAEIIAFRRDRRSMYRIP